MKTIQFKTYLTIFVFCIFISFPLLNDSFSLIKDVQGFENRKLAPKPKLNINILDSFPLAYESYYNDTFCLRSRIVKYFNLYNCGLLSKSPFPDKVVLGNDNWLFDNGDEMFAFQGKVNFSEKDLKNIKDELEYRTNYLLQKGCHFYILIAPCKASVYPENVPLCFIKYQKNSLGLQLIEYLKSNSKVKTINLFEAFNREKQNSQLYYSLDNHWNRLGAFHASNEFFKQVSPHHPEVTPLNFKNYPVTSKIINTGNGIKMLSYLDMFTDTDYEFSGYKSKEAKKADHPVLETFPYPWFYEEVKEIAKSKKPRLLTISDSFGQVIFPFLSENFSHSVKIWDNWEYKLNEDIVEKEKPDVCLLIIHEKNLYGLLKNQSITKNKN